jgi:3-deoxy-D-manno-octulosonate 8-phosphate phosphatase (KDO 8-P phosphatase)
VRALLTDVDGVWTDGGMYFDATGQALKRFDVKDGYIVRPLQRAGVRLVWVTGDESAITRARAQKLGIDEVHEGVEDKGAVVRAFLQRHGLQAGEAVYMGDDLNDLPAMQAAGFAACPGDAAPEVIAVADLVTSRPGGRGAVRELCDLILRWNQEAAGGSQGGSRRH